MSIPFIKDKKEPEKGIFKQRKKTKKDKLQKPQKPKKNRKGVFDIRLKQYFDKVFGETGIDD